MAQRTFSDLYCLLFLLCVGSCVRAQTTLDQTAEQICACVQKTTTERPRELARDCHRKISGEQQPSEELIDLLAKNCPYLMTLGRYENRKHSWSDIPGEERTTGYRYGSPRKVPPSFDPREVATEAPRRRELNGRLERKPTNGKFVLRGPEGEHHVFKITPELQRNHRWKAGEELRIYYLREWNLNTRRVEWKALEIITFSTN